MEKINYLLGYEDLKICQDDNMFKFSLDSVLLPNFVTINKSVKNILDIGCGNAVIPLILSKKTFAHIDGIEIQREVYELGIKSVKINNLEKQISLFNADIRNIYKEIETEKYDIITCNPPFFKINDKSIINKSDYKSYARHEINLNLDDIFQVSRKLLKNNGKIAIVHRPERLVEIVECMKKHGIEPKKIQFVYPKQEADSNVLLIEGIKNGKPGLKILESMVVHQNNGDYTSEIKKYFS